MAQDQASATSHEESAPKTGENVASLPVRRSGRVRKKPSVLEDSDYQNEPSSTASPPTAAARRNPKRKAAPEAFDVPDNLLDVSLGPWKEQEQSEWPSWTELESDPAFFTAILRLLGVKGAKIEDVLSVDEDSLAALPQPVYGLVFLYEYVPEESSPTTEISQDMWFANQTTHNACATIALLNIIMNAEGLDLGDKLRAFKEESMGLPPPLRGNLITNSAWIRMAHNSYARRLDLLDAALSLQNEVDRKKRAKSSSSKRKNTTKERKKSAADSAYHFIAFVPVGQRVWQLDGLKSAPVCIGEYAEGQHWTSVMRPVLAERMMRYETELLSFNLLALCGDSFARLRRRLASNVRSLESLVTRFGSNADWPHPRSGDENSDIICRATDKRLSTYQLDAKDIERLSEDGSELPEFAERAGDVGETVETGLKLWGRLGEEQKRIRSEFERELQLARQEPTDIFGRTKDHTAAIHEWVKKLAHHGVLKKLHEQVQLYNSL